ncbi:hypothetical protein Ancab_038282 [Ancistrocladus abbreviatus]
MNWVWGLGWTGETASAKKSKHVKEFLLKYVKRQDACDVEEESFPSYAAEAIYNMNLISKLVVLAGKCNGKHWKGRLGDGSESSSIAPVISLSTVLIQLVNFAEAIVMTKRSTEKLFKFLDMYETLQDLASTVDESLYTKECVKELKSELHLVSSWLGKAIVLIFCELENSTKHKNAKTLVPNGVVHLVTHYTVNYLKDACEYKDTLEQVFQQHKKADQS